MGITGDFAKLGKLVDRIGGVASGEWMKNVLHKQFAREARTQVQLGFRQSRDPYGVPWEHTEWSSPKPLRKSGMLGNSFTSEPTDAGFVVGTSKIYARSHQEGLTIKAKPGKVLAWKKNGGKAVGFTIGQRTLKSGKVKSAKGAAIYDWAFAKSVTLRKRMMVPEDSWGRIWAEAMRKVADVAWKKLWKV